MSYDIHTRINLISSSLSKVERLLEKADKVRRTKNEMHSCVKESIEIVRVAIRNLLSIIAHLTLLLPEVMTILYLTSYRRQGRT